jgi:phage terminase large subunit
MAAIWGIVEPLRILCTRELQVSIKESFHAELKSAIATTPWLAAAYDVGIDYIRGKNGTEFIFRGLRHNIGAIKGLAQIDLCIVEEAEDIPEASWIDLEPTIRAPLSEIWVIWNPRTDGSPVDKRFVKDQPPRSAVVQMNYMDNPWFPMVLDEQRQHQRLIFDDATYAHIWEGAYLQRTDAQIFAGKFSVADFEPGADWDGPYCGLDFGFAQDPTAAVKAWVYDNRLYIEYEAGRTGLELDDTARFVNDRMPGFDEHAIRADSARPESISYLKRHGLPRIQGAEKGKGSVEDGIEFIKSFSEVVIHSRCTGVIEEFRKYSYKVDRLSGDVLPVIVDSWNHYIDALRYALEPIMKQQKGGALLLPRRLRR